MGVYAWSSLQWPSDQDTQQRGIMVLLPVICWFPFAAGVARWGGSQWGMTGFYSLITLGLNTGLLCQIDRLWTSLLRCSTRVAHTFAPSDHLHQPPPLNGFGFMILESFCLPSLYPGSQNQTSTLVTYALLALFSYFFMSQNGGPCCWKHHYYQYCCDSS